MIYFCVLLWFFFGNEREFVRMREERGEERENEREGKRKKCEKQCEIKLKQ